MGTTTFHGTQIEGRDLVAAVAHHCTCRFGVFGVRLSTCPPHQALIEDQVFLDGLLFTRWRLRRDVPDAAHRTCTS